MQVGELSPDRLWRWDGLSWVPTTPLAPPLMPVASYDPSTERATVSRRSWAATAGGVMAMVAGPIIIGACALPYVNYPASSSGSATSYSIFNPGSAQSYWFAVEPVAVAVLAIVAGVILVAWMSRIPRAVASGLLLAFGVQTFLLFAGYTGLGVFDSTARVGVGSGLGLLSGLLLLAGGVTAVVTLFAGGSRPTV